MTTIKISQCDRCGKRVDNRKREPGWIHFDLCNAEVSMRTESNYLEEKGGADMDFCSFTCMFDWFKEGCEPTDPTQENPEGIHGESQ
jgi:hypothetical protein